MLAADPVIGPRDRIAALSSELDTARDEQAATRGILRIISTMGPGSRLEPVLTEIVATAARLCAAEYALAYVLKDDGRYHTIAANEADAALVRYAALPNHVGGSAAAGWDGGGRAGHSGDEGGARFHRHARRRAPPAHPAAAQPRRRQAGGCARGRGNPAEPGGGVDGREQETGNSGQVEAVRTVGVASAGPGE